MCTSFLAASMCLFTVPCSLTGLGTCSRYQEDPYLKYRPPFVRSLPVQLLLTGVILTLTVVLLIHLLFTAQYHWPLAPVNYVLQISGVTTLLVSLIATIHVVLSASLEESSRWPYMLSYIAIEVPPSDEDFSEGWSTAETTTWAVMTASTSGLVQVRCSLSTTLRSPFLIRLRSHTYSFSHFYTRLS